MNVLRSAPSTSTIIEQEQRVRDADGRLRETAARARLRLQGFRRPRASPLWGVGSLLAGWLMLQRRRRSFAVQSGVRRAPFALLLDIALPALAPVIGTRVAGLLGALATATDYAAQRAPAVAALVDLDLYAGTWYEIARLPARHERKCAGEVTATYWREAAGLRVVNRCRRADGRIDAVRGQARIVDRRSRAKLKVTFAPSFLRWLPWAWADYWILDVSPDYRRALVGTPDRRSLWMLAREPSISAPEFRAMRLIAAAQGYDTQLVRMTAGNSVL